MGFKPDNKQLSEWYLLLSQQLDAGITLSQAIQLTDTISGQNRADLVTHLDEGMDPAEVFERYAPWMPPTDRKLIAAANASGKLPEVLTNLSIRRTAMHENIQRAISSCIYPIVVVHMAALVTPIFTLIDFTTHTGSLTFHPDRYLASVSTALGITWALIIAAGAMLKQNNPRALSLFPIIRHYSVLQSIADFSSLLSSFLKAGVTVDIAWMEAGTVSRDKALADYADKIALEAREGTPPSKMLNPKASPLPPEFISLYVSGEQTGQLDKNLDLLARLFQEKANLKLKQASEWYPIMIFLCVAVYVGFGLVRFYTQYLDLLMSIIRPGHRVGM
jgi:general secretion pathway protein F/type IV pilus assembly protein PilC